MNKLIITIEAALLVVVLAVIDFTFRSDTILHNAVEYLLALGATFLFIILLRLIANAIPWKPLSWLISLIFGIALGLTYGIDYNYYSTYGRFMAAHEYSMLIGEFGYWQSNVNNLFSNEELFSLVLYTLPFLVVFSGIAHTLLSKILFRQSSYTRLGAGASSLLVILVLVAIIGTLKVIRHEQARYLLTPEFATFYGVRDFYKHPDTYKIKKPRVDYPPRKDDPTAVIKSQRKPNIVFMLFESINMKHTSMSNYGRNTTPNIKAYIEDAYQFSGVSNSTTTTFSTTSLFSGFDYQDIKINDTLDYPLLWWYTKQAGYQNHVFTSQWLRYRSKGDYFIDRSRTDTLKEPLYSSRSLGRDDHITVDILDKELPNIKAGEGTFLYVNFAGTHFPYRVGKGYEKWTPTRKKGFHSKYLHLTANQYDNALLYFDAAFKKTIDILKHNNMLDNSIIILASDHGEGMMEHGRWGHGPVYYQEGIEAPIYIKIGKDVKGQFSKQELQNLVNNQSNFVSNVDIFTTVLGILGIETKRNLSGHNLLEPYPPSVILSTRSRKSYMLLHSHTGFKVIVSSKNNKILCMNIKTDPDEKKITRYRTDKKLTILQAKELVANMTTCELPYEKF